VTLEFLLDTSIVSNPSAQQPNERLVARLERHTAGCAIAAPVWHELIFGTRRLPAGRRRDRLETYLQNVVKRAFPILPYDDVAAEWHGIERARLTDLGKTPPFVDGQIAAIARSNDLTLVTTNTKDFAPFKGLRVADWTR
jgi:tRNA(fMet)-specific endonuclease VapC